MKFVIQREALLKPLQIVGSVVERRQTLPILSNVLLEISPRGLALTATDLEVEIVVCTSLDSAEGGKTTLPARKFIDICRALAEDARLEISVEKDRATLLSGKSRFVLSTLPASEFPSIEDIQPNLNFSIEQATLKRLIEKTQFAMAHQDVRYYLNGLLLEVGPEILRAVATDGHRLAYCQRSKSVGSKSVDVTENQAVIIPRKGVNELSKLLSDSEQLVMVELATNHIRVVSDSLTFSSKLIDGRFPDYQRVIPHNADKLVVLDRNALRQAVQRTSILTSEKYRSIRFQLEPGTLRVWAHNPEQEEAEEELSIDYNGTNLEIGFNAGYLLEALGAVTGQDVELHLSDPNSCCLIQGVGDNTCKYVVMPMRL